MSRSALVLGSTGLVGRELLKLLLKEDTYNNVAVLTRREIVTCHPKLTKRVGNLDELERYRDLFKADDIYCCLGTTMKKAKSRENFRRVDYDYPLQAANMACSSGARRFLVISAIGANKNSPFFYNRVKGELESELRSLPFKSLIVIRPSLLLGEREEFRFGEKLGEKITLPLENLFQGPFRKYRPVKASDVALTMVSAALGTDKGFQVYESEEILRSTE
ncbi:oxidoreductase [Mesobacillus foraminis]|uniref:oxidoreductase n=1 Tax=Mesobacillus foraminis TaxID=279826 RepID=UPI000EF487E7|nr:oxidoreductase [Mesobacillus foraminis]